eukprot:m.101557 g.101557  ORF g.101557 m.101557 type:complete len:665 (+) comp14090_c7_seq3:760-2754(+)
MAAADNGVVDLTELHEAVASENQQRLSGSTRKTYASCQSRWLLWLYSNQRTLLTTNWQQRVEATAPDAQFKTLRDLLILPANLQDPPIHFDAFVVRDHFLTFLHQLKAVQTPEENASLNTKQSMRSALVCLFKDYDKTLSEAAKGELERNFQAKKRIHAKQLQEGQGNVNVGKAPLSFGLFAEVCRLLMGSHLAIGGAMTQARAEALLLTYVFAHCMLTLSWNLACRVSNTATVCYSHMSWANDAMQIVFAHMKNDQTGERPRDPRHLYANPFQPEVCCVLSLGIYLLCFQVGANNNGHLFGGPNPADRYSSILRNVLAGNPERLAVYGADATHIGTHSIRKGAATYLASGTTASPSHTSVCLRAGWAMHGVEGTYLRFEGAADQFCGRVVAGLPIGSENFAVSPPHFVFSQSFTESALLDIIKTLFGPHFPEQLYGLASFCLASVVHHGAFLSRLPKCHPIFRSALYSHHHQLLPMLRSHVHLFIPSPDTHSHLAITGIPPHVLIFLRLRQMEHLAAQAREEQHTFTGQLSTHMTSYQQRFQSLEQELQRMDVRMGQNITDFLEARAASLGQITPSAVASMLSSNNAAIISSFQQLLQPLLASPTTAVAAPAPAAPAPAAAPAAAPAPAARPPLPTAPRPVPVPAPRRASMSLQQADESTSNA